MPHIYFHVFCYRHFVVILKLQSSLVTFFLFIACPSNCVMHLWPKITLYHSRVRRAKLTVGEECQLIYRQVVSCYVRSFSYARKQTKHQRQNSLFEDLVSLREDALFSLFPGELPIFLILLSRTFHLRRSLC